MSYEELAAKALRPVPTLTQAEDILKKDFPVKLPARNYIKLWNTPEVSQFRGVQENLDEEARRIEVAQQQRLDIKREARESGASAFDGLFIAEALNRSHVNGGSGRKHQIVG